MVLVFHKTYIYNWNAFLTDKPEILYARNDCKSKLLVQSINIQP